jgi:hypothetical protein
MSELQMSFMLAKITESGATEYVDDIVIPVNWIQHLNDPTDYFKDSEYTVLYYKLQEDTNEN